MPEERPVPAPPVPGPLSGSPGAIESALRGLDGLAELEVSEHVARFDAAHAALTDALSSIDKV
ncbi:hypothetical protein F0L68_34570 [Solihabitans fulvus]|uniref:Uncharacterized protein n=2 Tax=Solihabitans fulvus TaxID=1892852 RepID=A0A5B2WQU3_9PSEU|nr:hypothetical protein F0L68_34570 [Solihabitans fulvus]